MKYFDGLGRPDQTNLYKGSGDASKDIISSVGYDGFGREHKQYLPFASAKNMAYHTTVTSSANFTIYGVDSDHAYSETGFEASPLNRIEKQAAPGDAWYLGSNHEQKFEQGSNSSGEVEYFYVNSSDGLSKGTDYSAGTLYKSTSWDENNSESFSTSRTEEFTDKRGNVVLKKSWDGGTEHQTYYVYDDFNRLRFVLPPKAVEDESVSPTELSQLCYQYKYDERGRLIEKKLPGTTDWEYLVYDKRDRVVLTQTPTQGTAGYWVFTKYDSFNRPILSGKYTSGSARSTLQSAVNSESVMYESAGSIVLGYTNNAYPRISDESKYISATYYDDYSWGAPYSYSTVYTDHSKASNVTGLVTGVKTKVLGTSTWLTTVNYYDKYGRFLQQYQSNPDGGYNRTSTAYNFTDQPIKQQVYHKKTSGATAKTTEEKYSYDHMGRPTKVEHSYNGAGFVTIAQNTYDEIGRLQKKELHNTYQDIDYTYNVRGWLTKINNPDDNYSTTKLFAQELYYNTTGELVNLADYAQHNGNIAGIRWRNNSTKRAAYAFTYDGLNRLKVGDYGYTTSSGSVNVTNYSYYDLSSVGYDKNGNISNLTRKTSSGGTKESLTYTYAGNQLSSLSGTYNGSGISGKTFVYDANGNAKTDNLRGITIQYFDEIDLPKKYTKGAQYSQYEYDAEGTKWSKTAVTSGTSTMEYYGSFIYQDGTLDRVLTSEGYYLVGNSKYHYNLKDHLGSTRMVVSYSGSTPTVEQVIEYYPFGSLFSENNLSKNKYLYNGKELQNEFFENYDYGARFYDPELGRFHTVDPKATDYYFQSPYVYAANDPIKFIDLNGENPWEPNGDGTWTAEKGDGAVTLSQDAGISQEKAYAIMAEQGYGTYVDKNDGIIKSAVDVGDVVDVNSKEIATAQKEIAEAKSDLAKNVAKIESNTRKIDSLNKVADFDMELSKSALEVQKSAGTDGPGAASTRWGLGVLSNKSKRAAEKNYDKAESLSNKNDSLQKVNNTLKKIIK
uniref:DUF6443 domain-containing protein n=1 Tax=Draconibacterium mangrovi TaxID=2697469 RepID=UPI0013D56606|nr:DUF6443 domain-containing protein [Draconibacterium mangrovi]